MRTPILRLLLAAAIPIITCNQQKVSPSYVPKAAELEPNRALVLVKKLDPDLPTEALTEALDDIIHEIARAKSSDMEDVYGAVDLLSKQPHIIESLVQRYRQISDESFTTKRFLVQIVGQLQRPEAASFLKEVIWAPLPALPEKAIHGLSKRDWAETVQVKAVHGLMFLRADDDLDEVIAIVREHESAFVRFEAINAYLWNHDDSEDAAENLRRALAEEFHKYIEMPRFAKGIDAYEFDRHVEEWQARWGGK